MLEKEGSRRFPPRTSGVRSNWHVLRAGPAPSAFHRYFTSSTHNPTAQSIITSTFQMRKLKHRKVR